MNKLPPAMLEYRQLMGEEAFQSFMIDLIEIFKDVTPDHFVELKEAFKCQDDVAFKRAAHSLKSSGRTFAIDRCTAIAAKLEDRGCLENIKDIEKLIQSCEVEFNKAMSALDALKEKL